MTEQDSVRKKREREREREGKKESKKVRKERERLCNPTNTITSVQARFGPRPSACSLLCVTLWGSVPSFDLGNEVNSVSRAKGPLH